MSAPAPPLAAATMTASPPSSSGSTSKSSSSASAHTCFFCGQRAPSSRSNVGCQRLLRVSRGVWVTHLGRQAQRRARWPCRRRRRGASAGACAVGVASASRATSRPAASALAMASTCDAPVEPLSPTPATRSGRHMHAHVCSRRFDARALVRSVAPLTCIALAPASASISSSSYVEQGSAVVVAQHAAKHMRLRVEPAAAARPVATTAAVSDSTTIGAPAASAWRVHVNATVMRRGLRGAHARARVARTDIGRRRRVMLAVHGRLVYCCCRGFGCLHIGGRGGLQLQLLRRGLGRVVSFAPGGSCLDVRSPFTIDGLGLAALAASRHEISLTRTASNARNQPPTDARVQRAQTSSTSR